MKGHWFCDACNDVVNIRGIGQPDEAEECPVCHQRAAVFVADEPSPRLKKPRRMPLERGNELFRQLRRSLDL